MRASSIAAGLRRPLTVIASVAVIGAVSYPLEAQGPPDVVAHRIVATPTPVAVFTPTELEIPKISLRAPVVPVGTEADGTMGSPTNGVDIGWWNGRKPGEGNALFDAHRNWNGRLGSFGRLKELRPGDEVIVRGENHAARYRVIWLKPYDRNFDATELLGNTGGKQMATLITCEGVFDRSIGTSLERLVARAELVSA